MTNRTEITERETKLRKTYRELTTERDEIVENAERLATAKYRAHAKRQREYLERAYNAAPSSPVARVTPQVSFPAFDYVAHAARLYVSPMTSQALAELDDVSRVIVLTGIKTIVGVGALLSFVALVFG